MLGMHIRLATAGLLAACLTTASLQTNAQDVRWDMESHFPGSFGPYGESGVRFVERVREISEGRFEVRFRDSSGDSFGEVAAGSHSGVVDLLRIPCTQTRQRHPILRRWISVRPGIWRIPCLDDERRRERIARGDLQPRRAHGDRHLLRGAGELGVVQDRNHVTGATQGPQDARGQPTRGKGVEEDG